ncbi:hypothetical protein E2C01_090322 [Portunus trituberculatus]|uniref:Uncharacterized protein n=1 Tax=Portunus trituberculatus TaxID=210409 RepID=A0A5B7JLI9_PORTR|nr:hypothetical protein [Portunus trituberculatus]
MRSIFFSYILFRAWRPYHCCIFQPWAYHACEDFFHHILIHVMKCHSYISPNILLMCFSGLRFSCMITPRSFSSLVFIILFLFHQIVPYRSSLTLS